VNAIEERVMVATSRSRQLRSESRSLHPVLARAYRRRACELDLEAFLHRVVATDVDLQGVEVAPLTVDGGFARRVEERRSRHAAWTAA
jgi:hypothetical protein